MLLHELGGIEGYADPVCWLSKPDSYCTSVIVRRIPHHRKAWTVGEWADAIQRGQTILPSILSKAHKSAENVVSQQIFPVDIDHETNPLSPCMTINRYREHSINPAILYHSMNSKPYAPRYRVVVITDRPAIGAEQISMVYSALISIATPTPDLSTGDLSRMFFGASSRFPMAVRRLWELDDGNGEAPTVEQLIALAPSDDSFRVHQEIKEVGGNRRRNPADEYLLTHVDLLAYVRKITGERGTVSGRGVKFHRCPVCGHFDHFYVYPHADTPDLWMCWGSHGVYIDRNGVSRHPGGTIVDLMIHRGGEINGEEEK